MRADEAINDEEFAKKKSEFLKEKERLSELLKDNDYRVDRWIEKAEDIFNFAEKAKYRFENGSSDEKRAILEPFTKKAENYPL